MINNIPGGIELQVVSCKLQVKAQKSEKLRVKSEKWKGENEDQT
jgi:hypothetical protein